ncbi:Protein CEPU-1 [Araneus ventricosus]|uniref:Protein CEPU-1 n=1 Tax=Araneus ventricosus TaxID=182803 RepID=A0A4Y2SNZ7_ARAVE|nr:Protein CEPU-1 [Araneus ventricosus]GBN90055.1 Protein CEPU-1 [Araneus ventricosus]GBN90062.1 Protein CEPU-1 [Araneus ventricosus]
MVNTSPAPWKKPEIIFVAGHDPFPTYIKKFSLRMTDCYGCVPPHIEEEETSSDTEVREGSDVSLRCVAKGSPDPETTWRREDGQEITIGRKKVTSIKSTNLNITKVGRLQMGAYLCIASNGVQPSVSKRIVLNVNFPPMIWIPSQLVGAPVGTDVTLACNLESFPQSVTYWNRESGTMVLTNDKYNSVLLNKGLYKVTMQLTIRNLKPEDFGAYTCVAKNSLGETEGTIRLYGKSNLE